VAALRANARRAAIQEPAQARNWQAGARALHIVQATGRVSVSEGMAALRPMEDDMVARMRHIALLVTDPEKSAQFYEKTLGFKRAGQAGRGLYMSDGTINMALLKVAPEKGEKPGLYHFGMWVDDLDESEKTVTSHGGSYLHGREDRNPNTFYEVKYRDPDGIVFDITPTGWRGAVKEVLPAEPAKEAAE
jgi:lactoylglutathione lyase